MNLIQHHTEFFTATNLNWLPVLNKEIHKQILIEAIQHRVHNQQLVVNAFVIMPNHFHAIWKISDGVNKADFQRDFMKFTARSILKFMFMNNDPMLSLLQVKAADRKQQVWERNSLSIELYTEQVFLQKLDYIHNNPLQPKWNLCLHPEDYYYSSVLFYETGGMEGSFNMLTHFRD
ncbi:MAG: transposase [Ferruginibacter sp.]|nr:transposase [Ferruginibacter sp.]